MIRYYLIELLVNYRMEGGKEVIPNTMRCYLFGIQRYFTTEWRYKIEIMNGPLFACKKNGLMTVCDNRFREQQASEMTVVSHNALSSTNFQRLFSSPQLSRDTSAGFQCRVIFEIALSTAMCPTGLHGLLCSRISDASQDVKPVISIFAGIGSTDGTCKAAKGGWKYVKLKPKEVYIFQEPAFDRSVNIHDDVQEYCRIRSKLVMGVESNDRFFAAINPVATSRSASPDHNRLEPYSKEDHTECMYDE